KICNRRGKVLMQELNECGLWLLNGVHEQAAYTFENANGASCIDLIWCSDYTETLEGCDVWTDLTCTFSDHALVTTTTRQRPMQRKKNNASNRREAWKRSPTEEWRQQGNDCWHNWIQDTRGKSTIDKWEGWKVEFKKQAT